MSYKKSKRYNFIEENECEKNDTYILSRCFCITLLNYTDADIELLRRMKHIYKPRRSTIPNEYIVKYICFGFEITEDSIPYIQCYVQFTKNISAHIVSNIYSGCRIVKTKGFPDKSIYTDIEEHGTKMRQGARLDIIRKIIESTETNK
jgi:hypothetical protein